MRASERSRALQSRLSDLGCNPGSIDGQWGDASSNALMQFQSAQRLPATGQPSAVIFARASAASMTAPGETLRNATANVENKSNKRQLTRCSPCKRPLLGGSGRPKYRGLKRRIDRFSLV